VTARRVLVTGVANFWGERLAARLAADPGVEAVIGLDDRAPDWPMPEGVVLVEGDVRSPDLGRLIRASEPDTIVHNGIIQFPGPGRSSRTVHDLNVVGTLQLLAACEDVPTLRTLVVRASAAIYGSEPRAPEFFTEDMAARTPLRTRFQRDLSDLEAYITAFARRRPTVTCTVLRLQPVVGRLLETPVTRLLRMPVVPTVLGFDPRLQVLHEDDSVDALAAAVRRPVAGAVNVAGAGAVSLTRTLVDLRRPFVPIPHPVYGTVTSRLGFPEDMVRYLRFGRAVDTTRLREEIGFTPRTTAEALEAVA
jgi:UDP-glucose 4-epimerase